MKTESLHMSADTIPGQRGRLMHPALFFGLLAVFHAVIVLQGLDMLDEGFHATFYQQLFRDPASVQYAFFYWLSGIAGASVLEAFPGAGLLGLRLAGALVSLLTIWITYRPLRRLVREDVLQLSIIILALFMILLSGFVCMANMYTRTPNLLGLALVLVILYAGFLYPGQWKRTWRYCFLFAGGAVLANIVVLLVMQQLGHLDYFVRSIQYLSSMSSTTDKKDGLGGGYGLVKLIYVPVKQYSMAIASVLLVSSLVLATATLGRIRKQAPSWLRTALAFVPAVLVAGIAALVLTGKLKHEMLLYFLTGLSLLFSFLRLLDDSPRELKVLSALGILVILLHPFGSAPGIITVVIYSMWISLPIALDYLADWQKLDLQFSLQTNTALTRSGWTLGPVDLKRILQAGFFLVCLLCIYHIFRYPYFYDHHKRTEMRYTVDNPHMRHVYTSGPRAAAINELLRQSAPHVRPGDYVLAYDAIPLYHFMTETRPYLNNPSPMFYSTGIFAAEMQKAAQAKPLPVVICQKIKNAHEGSRWPEEIAYYNAEDLDRSRGKDEYLQAFLNKQGYREVWSNEIFRILVPPGKGF